MLLKLQLFCNSFILVCIYPAFSKEVSAVYTGLLQQQPYEVQVRVISFGNLDQSPTTSWLKTEYIQDQIFEHC